MHSIDSRLLPEGRSGLPNDLLNFGVELAAAELGEYWDDKAQWLFPPEQQSLGNAVSKRRREIIAGRLLAHLLLRRLGRVAAPIRQGEDRCPDWPEGIAGSITHTDTVCAVALCPGDQVYALGIDLEPRAALQREVWKLVCRPEELDMALRSPAPALWARWAFCAKEAFYKAQFPKTGKFFEPLDIAVTLDPAGRTFGVTVVNLPRDDRALDRCLSGTGLLSSSDHLLGAAWVVAADGDQHPGRPGLQVD
jgi:4'-phosphopantetheinyl transferase EntD